MKRLFKPIFILVVFFMLLTSLAGCTVRQAEGPYVFVVTNHKQSVLFGKAGQTLTDIAQGNLLYAEANGDKILSVVMDKKGVFQLLTTDLNTGQTTATEIATSQNSESIPEAIAHKAKNGTWILLPWNKTAIFIDKQGHIVFNSKKAFPDRTLPWSDSVAQYPLYTLEDGSAWLITVDKDDTIYAVYIDANGNIQRDINTHVNIKDNVRFGTFENNVVIGYDKEGIEPMWQLKILAPDGRTVLSTENIPDYDHGFTMPAGAGSPVTDILNDKIAIPYIDKAKHMHLLMLNSSGKIIYNKILDINYDDTALGVYILEDGSVVLINHQWKDSATLIHLTSKGMYTASVPDAWGYIPLGHIGIIQPSKTHYGGTDWFYIYNTETHKVEKIDGQNPEMLALLKDYAIFTTYDGGIFALSGEGHIINLNTIGIKGKISSMLYHKDMYKCSGITRCHITPVPEILFTTNDGINYYLYKLEDNLKLTMLHKGAPAYISDEEPFTCVIKSNDRTIYMDNIVSLTYKDKTFTVDKAPDGTYIYVFASNDYPYISFLAVLNKSQIIFKHWLMPDGGSYSSFYTQSDKDGIYSVFVGANTMSRDNPGSIFVYIKRR